MGSSHLSEIIAGSLVVRPGSLEKNKENLKVGGKKNMQRLHHKLVAGFPESYVAQICLSFSTDGRFTPPSSISTEAFLSAATGKGL